MSAAPHDAQPPHSRPRYAASAPVCRALSTSTLSAPLLIGLLIALTAGCSSPENPTESLADYNARLARALDAELPPSAATSVPTWPPIDEITQQPTHIRVDLHSDFGRCGLLREISERSSALGRSQAPSQRLLYEMRLLRGLRHCAEVTEEDLYSDDTGRQNFAMTIRNILELKTRDLPLVYWNATFGATELRNFFSVSALPLRTTEAGVNSDSANALAWLAALGRLSPDAPLPASDAMEQQYYQLIGNRRGGRTWLSMDLATRELDRSTKILQQAADSGKLCPNGVPTVRAQRLRNVFTEIYVPRVQPWLSAIAGESRVLSDALEKLWQAQQITAPPALSRYRVAVWVNEPGSLREDFNSSIGNHALAWRSVLIPCGFTPGMP